MREDPELDNLIKKFQLSRNLNLIKPFPKNVVSDHVKCIEVNISHSPVIPGPSCCSPLNINIATVPTPLRLSLILMLGGQSQRCESGDTGLGDP